jgi:hypothetical protein
MSGTVRTSTDGGSESMTEAVTADRESQALVSLLETEERQSVALLTEQMDIPLRWRGLNSC